VRRDDPSTINYIKNATGLDYNKSTGKYGNWTEYGNSTESTGDYKITSDISPTGEVTLIVEGDALGGATHGLIWVPVNRNSISSDQEFWNYNPIVDNVTSEIVCASDLVHSVAALTVAENGSRLFKGISSVKMVGTSTTIVGLTLTGAVAGYEIKTGQANTHTIVDLNVSIALTVGAGAAVIAGVAGAPFVIAGAAFLGAAYGIGSAAGGSVAIDRLTNNLGRNLIYPKHTSKGCSR
jgi:hypothetical protein